ncbi:MAG TPA: c-type cytochrome [Bacillales bacterium]|nr:c-type cytochrome [Bacillales bacterium]
MKKKLIGSYLFIVITVITIIGINNLKDNSKDSKAIAAGETVYNEQCMACHGATGKGEGAKAGTALNNQHFLNSVSDKDIYHDIKDGREGTTMPAFSTRVSEKDLNHLVAFIRDWQTEELKFTVPKTISGNIENGKKLYNLYCLSCHGETGAGKTNMGTSLSSPQYLKYTTDKQIWITTAYGREDTRMGPSLKGEEGVRQLKKSDITDIVTYVRSFQKE